jgi:hypothetical protein
MSSNLNFYGARQHTRVEIYRDMVDIMNRSSPPHIIIITHRIHLIPLRHFATEAKPCLIASKNPPQHSKQQL